MLLEAPQIWRMKRYNVLETELVYKQPFGFKKISSQLCAVVNSVSPFSFWIRDNSPSGQLAHGSAKKNPAKNRDKIPSVYLMTGVELSQTTDEWSAIGNSLSASNVFLV